MEIHGKLVDIHNQTIFAATVTIEGGRIADVRRNSHRGNLFIIPGLFDAHAHLESTHMIPTEFARIAVRHGTVATTFASRHLSHVMGDEGMYLLRENAAHTPLKFHFLPPDATPLAHCSTLSEARARHADGEEILVYTENLQTLLPLLNEDPKRCLFCSSRKTPDQLTLGHINLLIKRAIELGMDPIDAITCGTYREGPDAGLLRVGDPADFALVENLVSLRVLETYIDGALVFKGEPLLERVALNPPAPVTYPQIQPEDLHVPAGEDKVSALVINEEKPPHKTKMVLPTIQQEAYVSDPDRDLLKLVCLNNEGKPTVQFVEGFGLKRGAIASSTSGQLVAVGTSDQDIVTALNALAEAGGGLAISNQGKTDLFSLRFSGLLSLLDGEEIALRHSDLEIAAKAFGCLLKHPFIPLSCFR